MRAYPKREQKKVLAQWMGCSRVIWNAKCSEDRYKRTFARKYLPTGTFPPIDQTYSQYKNQELTPWLSECPSQILRNSAANWYSTYKHFLAGRCGRPKRKRGSGKNSIHLTRELFRFEKDDYGNLRLYIGTKKHPLGYLSIKQHRSFTIPASLRVTREHGQWFVSFCYEDASLQAISKEVDLDLLRKCGREGLEKSVVGIDRGVVKPLQLSTGDAFQQTEREKKKAVGRERYYRRMARAASRGKKGSKRRKKKLFRCQRIKAKGANSRRDFNHKASRSLVDQKEFQVIVLEDLKTRQMTKRAKPKKDETSGKWLKNGAKAKAGLNASILDRGWNQFELFLRYKAGRAGKIVLKIPAHHTSQECADCGHIHPSNRKDQAAFVCGSCGLSENADVNASRVIKKRAINLILHPGTGLSRRGVLQDTGRGATCKTCSVITEQAKGCETSKKREKALVV